MPENNEMKQTLEKTIDTLFSDTPGAPVSPQKAVKAPAPKAPAPKVEEQKAEVPRAEAPKVAPAPKAEAPKAAPAPKAEAPKAAPAPKAEAPKAAPATAPKAEAPKAEQKSEVPKAALTVSELKKLLSQRGEPRPMEKPPVWSIIMTVCTLILSLSAAGIATVAAYFYFGPGSEAAEGKMLLAYLSMVMCVLVCAVFVGFALGTAFMLRKIEKDIREIKSKL